jgi:hypothetical protein
MLRDEIEKKNKKTQNKLNNYQRNEDNTKKQMK